MSTSPNCSCGVPLEGPELYCLSCGLALTNPQQVVAYAVLDKNGNWAGIWKRVETAKMVARKPGDRVIKMTGEET